MFLRKKEHLARITPPGRGLRRATVGESGGNSPKSETLGVACPHPRRPAVDSGTHHGGGGARAGRLPQPPLGESCGLSDGLSGGVPVKTHEHPSELICADRPRSAAGASSCSRGHGAVAAPSRPVSLSLALSARRHSIRFRTLPRRRPPCRTRSPGPGVPEAASAVSRGGTGWHTKGGESRRHGAGTVRG